MSGAGTGRYPRELQQALQRRDDVDLVPVAATRRRADAQLSRIVQGIWREGAYYPFVLRRRAARLGVELVHCPAAFTPRVRDRPAVLTIHDVLPFRYPELFQRVVVAHSRLMWAGAARRAAAVITGSEHTKRELTELLGVAPERIAVTPYGVSDRFRPSEPDRGWLADRFGIDRPFVLCVGTLEPRKNLLTALQAFERVSERVDDCLLAVVGGRGWGNERFEDQLGRHSDRARLTGFVSDEDLVRLYAAADCFVYPSLYEGYGLPVLEAMACGTPVVASDTTSLPEVAGDAALLVPPTDVEAVANAVASVLMDAELAADLSRRGLVRARGLTWDACAEATVGVYQDVLARV